MLEENKRELIRSFIKQRSDDTFDIIVNEHLPLIYYFINRYNFSKTPYNRQDLVIELKGEIFNSIFLFDLDGPIDFHVFLYSRFRHRLIRILRYYGAQKRDSGISFYLEGDLAHGFGFTDLLADSYNIEYDMAQKSIVSYNLQLIQAVLSLEEMKIYRLYIGGYPRSEIAKTLKIDEDTVKKKLVKIRRKVRKLGKKRTSLEE